MGRLIPYAFLLAEVLVFFRRVLFSPRSVIPWDLAGYHLPLATFIARCFRDGEFPLWDPYTYCGFPFFANVQTQLFYPPALPFLALANLFGHEKLLDLLEWQIALHVFLGGVFAYWLLRRLGTGPAAAAMGATVFQLGGFFASQAQHLGAMCGAAWLPLAWLSVVSLAGRFTWRWTAVLAGSLAMSFLAGFPAVTAVVFASSLCLALVLWLLRRASWKMVAAYFAACAWAGALAAVQLLPAMELNSLSTAPSRGLWAGNGGGVPLQGLVSLVIPNYYSLFDLGRYTLRWNATFLYLYCGMASLLLALGVVVCRKGRHWPGFALVTLWSALWMLGESTPLGPAVFTRLPTALKSPLYAEFAMLSFVLGMAVLAGLGLCELVESRWRTAAWALVVLTAFDLTLVGSGRPMNRAPTGRDPIVTPRQFEGSEETTRRIRQLVNSQEPPWRVETVEDSMNWASSASVVQAPTAGGNEPLALRRILQVRLLFCDGNPWTRYYTPNRLDSPVVDLLNVRYVLSWAATDPKPVRKAGLPKIDELPGHRVYENRNALPRFFLTGRTWVAPDSIAALKRMASPDFEPRREAVVEGVAGLPGSGASASLPPVLVRGYGMRRVILDVESPVKAWLVSSETYYPGWRAFVDGGEQPLVMTNGAFRGLPVSAGKHRVEMRFDPSIVWKGAALSLAAWVLAFAAGVFGDNKRKREPWISSNT